MKICMLTTVHAPLDQRVFHKESKSLLKAGHSVTILAPDDEEYARQVDGVCIKTVKRARKVFHPLTMARVFILGLKQDCDVYHCHEPGSLYVCFLLKLVKKTKLVYDAHEHYPSLIAYNEIFPSPFKKIVHSFVDVSEKIICRSADSIITVNESLEKRYRRLNKTTIIYNVPSMEVFGHPNSLKESKMIIHSGNVSKKRGLDKLLIALTEVRTEIPDVKLLLIGKILDTEKFKQWVKSFISENQLDSNIEFVNWVPHEEVARYTERSEIGFILFQPIYYNNIIGLPNKLFEYMACKTAVIASNFPEIKKVVEEYNCGLLIDPTNIKELKDSIIWLLKHPEKAKQMGENGRIAVEEKYNWENMEERLFKLYEELA